MKRYTYPAVLYSDGECYVLSLKDLNLVASGETVEEAFNEMLIYLETFLSCALKFEEEIAPASRYDVVAKAKSKNIVLLVSARIEEKI